jgi:hypothetical protein
MMNSVAPYKIQHKSGDLLARADTEEQALATARELVTSGCGVIDVYLDGRLIKRLRLVAIGQVV